MGRKSHFSRAAAEQVLKRKNAELSLGHQILHTSVAPRFSQFVEDYGAWHAAEHPDSNARIAQIIEQHLLPTFGQFFMDAIHPQVVEAWKQKRLASGVKSATVLKELRTLNAIINKAVAWRKLKDNPISDVAGPKQLDSKPPMFYTAEELQRLYDVCRRTVNDGLGPQPNHAAWWKLFVNTGMRRAEAVQLLWSWVGKTAIKLPSTKEARTKSGKWREIPLTPGAKEALEALPKDGQYVLPRITLPSLSRAFVRDAKLAGLGGGLHTLRHTYISHLVMQGAPLRAVQKLAGHSSVAVTERYAHLAPDYLHSIGGNLNL